MKDAFGWGGWFWEGLSDGMRGIGKIIMWLVIIAVAAFVARWIYTEWYISTHCTMVVGTRVCQ